MGSAHCGSRGGHLEGCRQVVIPSGRVVLRHVRARLSCCTVVCTVLHIGHARVPVGVVGGARASMGTLDQMSKASDLVAARLTQRNRPPRTGRCPGRSPVCTCMVLNARAHYQKNSLRLVTHLYHTLPYAVQRLAGAGTRLIWKPCPAPLDQPYKWLRQGGSATLEKLGVGVYDARAPVEAVVEQRPQVAWSPWHRALGAVCARGAERPAAQLPVRPTEGCTKEAAAPTTKGANGKVPYRTSAWARGGCGWSGSTRCTSD